MGRIRFGASKCHYAPITTDGTGKITYDTPIAIPGLVSFSFEAEGDTVAEYADDIVWYSLNVNNGYKCKLSFEDTQACDEFIAKTCGFTKDTDGKYVEGANDTQSEFALMLETQLAGAEANVKAKRLCFYRCVTSRPTLEGETKADKLKIANNEVEVVAMPRGDDYTVKASCISTDTCFATWFEAVPVKTA